MATRSLLLPVLIAVLLGLAESPARAIALDDGCTNDPVCRQHYDTALELFQDGRYEAALSEFQAAYAQRQMPWLLVNIGRTLHRLGRLKEAIAHYQRYQQSDLGTDPETSQKAREYLAQARLLLAQAPKAGSADSATGGQPAPFLIVGADGQVLDRGALAPDGGWPAIAGRRFAWGPGPAPGPGP